MASSFLSYLNIDYNVFFCAASSFDSCHVIVHSWPLELVNLLQDFYEAVDFFACVVDVEACSGGRLQFEDLVQWLGAVVAAAYHYAVIVEE